MRFYGLATMVIIAWKCCVCDMNIIMIYLSEFLSYILLYFGENLNYTFPCDKKLNIDLKTRFAFDGVLGLISRIPFSGCCTRRRGCWWRRIDRSRPCLRYTWMPCCWPPAGAWSQGARHVTCWSSRAADRSNTPGSVPVLKWSQSC